MPEKAFSFLNIPHRPDKPRPAGLTMMIDWGLGPAQQKDVLKAAGEYIDIAKIAVGLAGIIPEKILREKLAVYADHQIEAFIGGQFLEYAVFHQGLAAARPYFAEARRLGFKIVEVSDNNLEIKAEDKAEMIRRGCHEFGLKILGEVGSKRESTSPAAMVQGIRSCLAAGAWKVFVEGAEFTNKADGSLLVEVIEGVTKGVDLNDILFELPGPWIHNVHISNILSMMAFLIEAFGPAVNIANVAPEWIAYLETLRTGVGVKLG